MDDGLSSDLKRRDRERWLSVLYAPEAARPALIALHAYDLEQLRVVADAREPMLAEIRLAWWRDQLDHLAGGAAAPPQPILQALAAHAVPRGLDPAGLSIIEEGFLPLLTDGPLDPLALATSRGAPLFRALATVVLGRAPEAAEAEAAELAGTRWALARLWRPGWGQAELRLSRLDPPRLPDLPATRLPASLAVLDALAHEDWARLRSGRPLRRAASAGRQWRMLRTAISAR